jgi:hypothetical protein
LAAAFALCRDAASANAVAAAMTRAVTQHIGGEPQTYVSPIALHGARVIVAGPKGPALHV